MTRIAYVSADLGVPIFGRKGCSIHAQEVLGALVRRGADVTVFSTRVEGAPPSGLEQLKIEPLPIPPKGDPVAREKAALLLNAEVATRLERAGRFDFVYERYSLWSYGAMEFARAAGIAGLVEVNAPLIDEQAQYRVLIDRPAAESVAKRAFGAAKALLAVSEEVAAWLKEFAGTQGKIHVVPNGIRPQRFPSDQVPLAPAQQGVFTVGFVGTLKAWHGLSVLVEAFDRLHTEHQDTRLLIVGEGPERKKIEADLAQRGLAEAARFTGAVGPEEVPGFLASMDVAVAPYPPLNQFYFSPLKVYEYMAAGRAVVASGIGQLNKLIQNEQNGLLVPPGDPDALARALARLRQDRRLCEQLGAAGRQTVLSGFTWDSVVERIFQLAAPNERSCLKAASY
jgi:glycosyltransferase involved in cell wall biosynthesis